MLFVSSVDALIRGLLLLWQGVTLKIADVEIKKPRGNYESAVCWSNSHASDRKVTDRLWPHERHVHLPWLDWSNVVCKGCLQTFCSGFWHCCVSMTELVLVD